MTPIPLHIRIGEALDRHRDVVLELQELAAEFTEDVSRIRSMADGLQSYGTNLDTAGTVMKLPAGILPKKRETEAA